MYNLTLLSEEWVLHNVDGQSGYGLTLVSEESVWPQLAVKREFLSTHFCQKNAYNHTLLPDLRLWPHIAARKVCMTS